MGNQQAQAFEDLRNTVSECSRIVRYRWRIALVGLSVVGTIAFWYSQYLPRKYSAATIFERRDDVVLQNLIQGNSPYGFDHLKTTMAFDMTGSRALATAAESIGLTPPGTFVSEKALTDQERRALDNALGAYQLKPTVRLMHSSSSLDTIQLQCEASDPKIARLFVVALRDNYITQTRERIREILSSTKDFFEQEVARLQERVSGAAEMLQRGFEEFPGLDPTDLVSVGNRLEAIRGQYNATYQRKSELEAEISAREQFLQAAPAYIERELQEQVVGPPPAAAVPTQVVDPALDEAINAARRRIVTLKTSRRMTDEHPEVVSLRSQLEALEGLRDAVLAQAPIVDEYVTLPPSAQLERSKAFREWKAQQVRVELELDALRRQLEVATAEQEKADARLTRFATLYDQLLAKGDELRKLRELEAEGSGELAVWQRHLSRLERILAAESGQRGTQFTLIEEPKDVVRPIKPRVASVFVVCSGLGLAAAALIVALAELLDRSFRSVGQVSRALGVPVLESVGVIATPREKRRAALRRMVWTPTLAVLLLLLFTSATLAYASVEMPGFHQRAMNRVDRVIDSVGLTWHTAGRDRSA